MHSSNSKTTCALLDTCVLAPMPLCDTLLRCAEGALFDPVWSIETLVELRRTLRKFGRSEAQIDRRFKFMEAAFPEACVHLSDALLNSIPEIPDPGDRHVIAAAVAGRADVIVTFNLRHFPSSILGGKGIEVRCPDVFLVELFRPSPPRLVEILDRQAIDIRQPKQVLLDALRGGLPAFVALVENEK
jgi:predicted nucleic acid-binding protein